MDLVFVNEAMITTAVRKHSALFDCPDAHDECLQEIIAEIVEDLELDGYFYTSFYNLAEDWAEETNTDLREFGKELGFVYLEFLPKDIVDMMVTDFCEYVAGNE